MSLKISAPDGTAGNSYKHTQLVPTTTWNVSHNLGRIPSTVITDSSGNEVQGCIVHTDNNNLVITFNNAFTGTSDHN